MSRRQLGDLESTEMESGVSLFTDGGFCVIRVLGTVNGKPVLLRGQLSPDEMRLHALKILEIAEAAESDAAVLATYKKIGLPDEMWAHFITLLREHRATPDPGHDHPHDHPPNA